MTKPSLPITSANRLEARKWLTAQGLPGAYVRSLPVRELNRLIESPAALTNALLDVEEGVIEPASPAPTPKSEASAVSTPALQPDQLAALATLLQSLTPKQELDETRIIELIKQHATRPTQIEIVSNGETRTVDGAHHCKTPMLIKIASIRTGGRRPNIWLAGPAGSGKTTAAEQVAKALGLPFFSTGAIQTEYRLTGFVDANGAITRTPFREAFEYGGVFLWDEIDGSNPNALVAFNQALANNAFAFPDGMVERHPDFIAIAAANTFGHGATTEYVGRNRIDGATLDRFIFVEWDYDRDLERQLAGNDAWVRMVQLYRDIAEERSMRHIISPRASIDGAALLAAGLPADEVVELTILKGLPLDQRVKLTGAVADHLGVSVTDIANQLAKQAA